MFQICIRFIIIIFNAALIAGSSFCSEQYCQSYRERTECPLLSLGCRVQNETHNGELFPAAEPCNCCDICLENIKEGGFCTQGSIDSAPPLFICGPGLYCTKDNKTEDHTCQKMTHIACFKGTIEFDKNILANRAGSYMQRPRCDGDGNYQPIKCMPGQSCFCVDEEGNRIFGEAPHSLLTELTMKCECSRLNDKMSKLMPSRFPVMTARCLADGSYDPLQCREDICMCVDQNTGYSATDVYNITEVSYVNLPCYNKTIHRSWTYLHNCELLLLEQIEDIQTSEAEGYTIINFRTQRCQSDGWFWPVEQNSTHKYCVDKYGRKLKDYAALKNFVGDMNCLCARTESLLAQHKSLYQPECCENGDFKRVQCRLGECYCVDKNGLQITREVAEAKVSTLTCYNNGNICP